jgi:hypothetical protein
MVMPMSTIVSVIVEDLKLLFYHHTINIIPAADLTMSKPLYCSEV